MQNSNEATAAAAHSEAATAPVLFRIYGKYKNEKRFKPLDLSEGKAVINLIYASMLTESQKTHFMETAPKDNPEWTFEARLI